MIDDGLENGCKTTGFPGSRGANNAEMLAEQLINQNISRHRTILVYRADWSCGDFRASVNLCEILSAGEIDGLVQRRISGDSALKTGASASILNFANELELDKFRALSEDPRLGSGTLRPVTMP